MTQRFDTARIRVLRRTEQPADLPEWAEQAMAHPTMPVRIEAEPTHTYDVLAWPPGDVASPLLPQLGDELRLPGHSQRLRVEQRALTWPRPGTGDYTAGRLQCDLVVTEASAEAGEPAPDAEAEDGRWHPARLVQVTTHTPLRESGVTEARRVLEMRFAVAGDDPPGSLQRRYWVSRAWEAGRLGFTVEGPPDRKVDVAELAGQDAWKTLAVDRREWAVKLDAHGEVTDISAPDAPAEADAEHTP